MSEQIAIKGTLLELVIKEPIPLIESDRFKQIKSKVDVIVEIDDQQLEREVLNGPVKISELHDILQHEAELLFKYTATLKSVENVWKRYLTQQLTDQHYATYGRQNQKLTITDANAVIKIQPEVKMISLCIDRLSRIMKFLEDTISYMQYSYAKSIGDSIRLRMFLEGSGG